MRDKIAVLKLAGFRVRKTEGLWEWFVPSAVKLGGRLGFDSYADEETAWDSAWRYINGADCEEFDDEPWNTPKEDNT